MHHSITPPLHYSSLGFGARPEPFNSLRLHLFRYSTLSESMLPQLVAAVVRKLLEKKTPPQTLGKLGSARRTRVGTARAYKTEQEVKNLKKKGGESNEKERITSIQPAPVLDAVLGRTSRGRRDDLQGSY